MKAREPIRTDYPFALESANAVAQRLNSSLWEVSEVPNQSVTYRYAGGGVAATKIFSFQGDYPFTFSVSVTMSVSLSLPSMTCR